MSSHLATDRPACRVPNRVFWGSYTVVVVLTALMEGARWLRPESRDEALTGWLCGVDADWLPFVPLLLLAPVIWLGRRRAPRKPGGVARWLDRSAADSSSSRDPWLAALVIFVLAFGASRFAGQDQAGLPPAYHDEYSYLFQAQTFLLGRWGNPGFASAPELFDQMHVLNEGRFASRYFPGTGAWLAPFVAWGDPWLGQQLAHALAAMMVFWIGRELSNQFVGMVGGGLYALAPGPLLFSNLLLSHAPTVAALLVFLWAFLKWIRTASTGLTLLAGTALAFAMICRPMTAAGFSLPCGIWFLAWWITGRPRGALPSLLRRTMQAICLAAPLAAGMGLIVWQNLEITGSPWKSPYSLYTELHTPRHVYGFNNVVRGEQRLGPQVIDHYDRWAENLTPRLAWENVIHRIRSSLRWTLGMLPLLFAACLFVFSAQGASLRWGLIFWSILSLHLAHLPYWFVGIMGWHYVFETAPLWILIFAEATGRLRSTWNAQGARGMLLWWGALTAVAVCVNLVTVRPLWPGRLERGMAEVRYPRAKYAAFWEQVDQQRQGADAIVFIVPDAADRSMDYVVNAPDLQAAVLLARVQSMEEAQNRRPLFPGRLALFFDAASGTFRSLKQASP